MAAGARGRGSRGRGAIRGRRNSRTSTTTIDKRPRVLSITGFEADDKDEVLMHLSVSISTDV